MTQLDITFTFNTAAELDLEAEYELFMQKLPEGLDICGIRFQKGAEPVRDPTSDNPIKTLLHLEGDNLQQVFVLAALMETYGVINRAGLVEGTRDVEANNAESGVIRVYVKPSELELE